MTHFNSYKFLHSKSEYHHFFAKLRNKFERKKKRNNKKYETFNLLQETWHYSKPVAEIKKLSRKVGQIFKTHTQEKLFSSF